MSPAVQHASIAAWSDELHVRENRDLYREKFDAVVPMLADGLGARRPDAGFYLWLRVPGGNDEGFVRDLYEAANVLVLPGSYLASDAHGGNPGRGYVRMALVPDKNDCEEAARRMMEICR